jgi:hypothetical protein
MHLCIRLFYFIHRLTTNFYPLQIHERIPMLHQDALSSFSMRFFQQLNVVYLR